MRPFLRLNLSTKNNAALPNISSSKWYIRRVMLNVVHNLLVLLMGCGVGEGMWQLQIGPSHKRSYCCMKILLSSVWNDDVSRYFNFIPKSNTSTSAATRSTTLESAPNARIEWGADRHFRLPEIDAGRTRHWRTCNACNSSSNNSRNHYY